MLNQEIPDIDIGEERLLVEYYKRKGDPDSFNYLEFKSDLHGVQRAAQGQNNRIQRLSKDQEALYSRLAQIFKEDHERALLVLSLKHYDQNDHGYLSEKMIINAITDATTQLRSPTQVRKLSA